MTVHHGKLLVQEVVLAVSVVYEHVVDGVAVFAEGYSLQSEAVLHNTLVHLSTEEHFLAVHQVNGALGASGAVGDIVVDAVVEDYAVLQNLHHRAAFVLGSSYHHFLRDFQLHIDAAGKECAAGAKHEFSRDKRILGGAVGR